MPSHLLLCPGHPALPSFVFDYLFGFDLVGQKLLLMQRSSQECAADLLCLVPKCAVCSSSSLLTLPHHCTYICWICSEGLGHTPTQDFIFGRCRLLISVELTTQERTLAAKSREACWGLYLSCLLLNYHWVSRTSGPTPCGNAPFSNPVW